MKNQILIFISKVAFCLFWLSLCFIDSKTMTLPLHWFIALICSGLWLIAFYHANFFWKGAKE